MPEENQNKTYNIGETDPKSAKESLQEIANKEVGKMDRHDYAYGDKTPKASVFQIVFRAIIPGLRKQRPGTKKQQVPQQQKQGGSQGNQPEQEDQNRPQEKNREDKDREKDENGNKKENEASKGEAKEGEGGEGTAGEAGGAGEGAGVVEGAEVAGEGATIAGEAGAQGAVLAGEVAAEGAAVAGPVVIVVVIIVGLILLFLGLGLIVYCQQSPSPCGSLGFPKTDEQMSEERNLQYQLLALATGQFDQKGILDIINRVEGKLKVQTLPKDPVKAQEAKKLIDSGLGIIGEIRSAIQAKQDAVKSAVSTSSVSTVTVKPDPASDQTTTVPVATQTLVQGKLKELSEVLNKLQVYDVAVIFGDTALPIKTEYIKGYNSTIHGLSVARPYNTDGHRVFLGFTDCKNKGVCKGDAVDLMVDSNAYVEVYAPVTGTIKIKDKGSKYETVTVSSTQQKVTALLAHIHSTVSNGQNVSAGQPIGSVGKYPGWGKHLHFELWVNGMSIHHDPGSPVRSSGQGKVLWEKMMNALKGAA